MPDQDPDVEPDIKQLNQLREHHKKKMLKWYASGSFLRVAQTRMDKAPILLIGQDKHVLKEDYVQLSQALQGTFVAKGTYKSDKRTKSYASTPEDKAAPSEAVELGKRLFLLGPKGVERYLWSGELLDDDSKPASPQEPARIVQELKQRAVTEQIETDQVAWNEALARPGDGDPKTLLTNLFIVLVHGALVYRTNNKETAWQWWADGMSQWPVVSLLSHGGRVMIQLPSGPNAETFLSWLIPGKFMSKTRPFAAQVVQASGNQRAAVRSRAGPPLLAEADIGQRRAGSSLHLLRQLHHRQTWRAANRLRGV